MNLKVLKEKKKKQRQSICCAVNSVLSGSANSVGGTMNQCFHAALKVTVLNHRPSFRRGALPCVITSMYLLQEGSGCYEYVVQREPADIHWLTSKRIRVSFHLLFLENHDLSHTFPETESDKSKT